MVKCYGTIVVWYGKNIILIKRRMVNSLQLIYTVEYSGAVKLSVKESQVSKYINRD